MSELKQSCLFDMRGHQARGKLREWLNEKGAEYCLEKQGRFIIVHTNKNGLEVIRKENQNLPNDPEAAHRLRFIVRSILPETQKHPMGEWLRWPGWKDDQEAINNSPGRHTLLSALPSELIAATESAKTAGLRGERPTLTRDYGD